MHTQVKQSYDKIAKEFSQTRNYSWPEFKVFLDFLKNESSINLSKEFKILDVWCWNGRLYNFLAWELDFIDYKWIDISDRLLNEAKKTFSQCVFLSQDMTNLSNFEDNSFDLIFSIAAFHHIYKKADRLKHLSELKRVLKPGWVIFITNWNLFQKKYISCFFNKIHKKRAWNDTHVSFSAWWKKLTDRYYHAFTPSELKELYKKTDFIVLKEFFMRGKSVQSSFVGSFNICHVLKY